MILTSVPYKIIVCARTPAQVRTALIACDRTASEWAEMPYSLGRPWQEILAECLRPNYTHWVATHLIDQILCRMDQEEDTV